ncbi:MAG: protein kinase [Candidatus Schekmanbacteria bacterium]|nr:protein kinase [Candidatus Schekmanbacteria bacterium]
MSAQARGAAGRAPGAVQGEGAPLPGLAGIRTDGQRYEVRALLGKGGMGEVWRAFDRKLQVEVALKLVWAQGADQEQLLAAIRREILAAREVHSPGVCRIYDLVEIDGHDVVSMEYVDGRTLRDRLGRDGPLSPEETPSIAFQLLAGLEAIHAVGLVHRDIKPANLMITRAGRLVIMDFGLAVDPCAVELGSCSGTPAYMSPEQARGDLVDERSDVFSAALVLAELLFGERPSNRILPARLPEHPWRPHLQKALAADPAERFPSARSFLRALEETSLETGKLEGANPYPGLESFTEGSAGLFFGREAEVEALWSRIERKALLALIGPSGAGKSSLLRAGILANRPAHWGGLYFKPGASPFDFLAAALPTQSDGEPGSSAVDRFAAWAGQSRVRLVVVDQFEELFTLNPPEVQRSFAAFLAETAACDGTHVLLSMRDDFLFRCHELTDLAGVFAEVTPLGSLHGAALRRAIVQPALRHGYRFDSEELVDTMMRAVEGERGALPLLGFTASRLWDERDEDTGLLTRASYDRVGGVTGGLAQHAEKVLSLAGPARLPVVRELFRNLVTSAGTRAVRPVGALLSLFDDPQPAREVIDLLVRTRLLSAFETSGQGQQVEIIHETLISGWPRLAHWRDQDVEGAHLREQLARAAEVWQQRERPEGLLWTGEAYRDFCSWRARYPGRLTAAEEAFARSMIHLDRRRRRRRRLAGTIGAAILGCFLVAVSALYLRAETARRASDASRLLALGQLEMRTSATGALAYATAGLEIDDTESGRGFAMDALAHGPTGLWVRQSADIVWEVAFSPDGEWLALGNGDRSIELWKRDGAASRRWQAHDDAVRRLAFALDGATLASRGSPTGPIRFWSIPGGELRGEIGGSAIKVFPRTWDRSPLFYSFEGNQSTFAAYHPEGGVGPPLLRLDSCPTAGVAMSAGLVAVLLEDMVTIRIFRLEPSGPREEESLTASGSAFRKLAISASGRVLAAARADGGIELLSLGSRASDRRRRRLAGHQQNITALAFSRSEALLGSTSLDGTAQIWDLTLPGVFAPLVLQIGAVDQMNDIVFHPEGSWALTSTSRGALMWPLSRSRARVLASERDAVRYALVTAGSRYLVSSHASGALHIVDLGHPNAEPRVLRSPGGHSWSKMAADGAGKRMIVGHTWGVPTLVSVEEGTTQVLKGFHGPVEAVAIRGDGRLAAAAGGALGPADAVIRVWDLETGAVRVLDEGHGREMWSLVFLDGDRQLASASLGGLHLWDLGSGPVRRLWSEPTRFVAAAPDGRTLLAGMADGTLMSHDLTTGVSIPLPFHGNRVFAVGFGPDARTIITGDDEGVVRYGRMGEEPHLLYGHEGTVNSVSFDPQGKWIVSGGMDGTVRLWPVPQGAPLHTLPHRELLARLRSLTNVRAVEEESSQTGYALAAEPFPGWATTPTW